MKAKREHVVPLPDRAIEILREVAKLRRKGDSFTFPGRRPGEPLSVMALAMALRRIEPGVTVHGFRSTFRDWAGDKTNFPREVAEAALAHTVKDKTEAAYRRATAIEKRRSLMRAWAGYLESEPATVTDIADVRQARAATA